MFNQSIEVVPEHMKNTFKTKYPAFVIFGLVSDDIKIALVFIKAGVKVDSNEYNGNPENMGSCPQH